MVLIKVTLLKLTNETSKTNISDTQGYDFIATNTKK
jgi:hypothetical protein